MDIKRYGCCLCEESELFCIDLHHVNPDIKTDTINRFIINGTRKQMVRELLKVVPVCANCHRKIEHGTIILTDETVNEFQDFLWTFLIDTEFAKYLQPDLF